jgi:hypothetical protein
MTTPGPESTAYAVTRLLDNAIESSAIGRALRSGNVAINLADEDASRAVLTYLFAEVKAFDAALRLVANRLSALEQGAV